MQLIFWQNILSPHQSAFLRALAEQGHQVTVVAVESMAEDRLALGWEVPDLRPARVVIGPRAEEALGLIETSAKGQVIHVMAGSRWTPLGKLAERRCIASRCRMGILTEAPDPRGFMGLGRWVKYTLERYTKGFHYDFVLAMGELGARWFRSCGYPRKVIFPFAYVAEPAPQPRLAEPGRSVSFLYVGRLIPLKGLDLLLDAFSQVASEGVALRLLGEGPERERLMVRARALGIQHRVQWLGRRDPAEVRAEMERADVTVLPSRKDGWGAVVNESLMAGTPVICSTACGAADLIREPWLGSVFRSGDSAELTRALKTWAARGTRTTSERERIRHWSNRIRGSAVAEYFVAIMAHVYTSAPRPIAPWRM